MAVFLENFGLEAFEEDQDARERLMLASARDGKCLRGYCGNPYIRHNYGDFEIVLTTKEDEENHKLTVTGMDTHCRGNAEWDVLVSVVGVDYDNPMRKRIAIKRKEDGGGLCVVDIMASDVLPSYMENDEIRMQVVAFPLFIDYVKDEEEYQELLPKNKFGNTMGLADGSIFPSGIFQLGDHERSPEDIDNESWSYSLIKGKVKCFRDCFVQFGDVKWKLVRTLIDTQFGELELIHTIDQVKEEHRENLKAGAIVTGVFVLSGDPAIHAYDDGMIRSEENDLRALRQAFYKGNAERIRSILSEDVTYTSGDGKEYRGPDEVIRWLDYVYEERGREDLKTWAEMATLQQEKPGDPLPYREGKRCIILSYREDREPEAIAFTDINADGYITKIFISKETRYVFRTDAPAPHPNLFDEIHVPDSFVEPMLARARFHNVLTSEECDTLFDAGALHDYPVGEYKRNAKLMYEAVRNNGYDYDTYQYMFGYMLAKAVENRVSESRHIGYYPQDIMSGGFTMDLPAEWKERIDLALDLGSQFYKDFCRFHPEDKKEDETYEQDIIKALVLVQIIGERFRVEEL